MAQHPDLLIPPTGEPTRFTSPSSGPRERINLPARERAEHAQNLISQLESIAPQAIARAQEQRALGLDAGLGIYLRFDSEPNFPLKFESLDLANSGIELCNVKTLADNTMQATIFVPEGRLELFLRKITAYRDENTTPRSERGVARPKNQDFVESISNIRLAALEALWTEDTLPFPERDTAISWEVSVGIGGWIIWPAFAATRNTLVCVLVRRFLGLWTEWWCWFTARRTISRGLSTFSA